MAFLDLDWLQRIMGSSGFEKEGIRGLRALQCAPFSTPQTVFVVGRLDGTINQVLRIPSGAHCSIGLDDLRFERGVVRSCGW